MRVPGVVFASRELLPQAAGNKALEQAADVATLTGIVRAFFAMPDVHLGYDFPIGGVAATDVAHGGSSHPAASGPTSPSAYGCWQPASTVRRSDTSGCRT